MYTCLDVIHFPTMVVFEEMDSGRFIQMGQASHALQAIP